MLANNIDAKDISVIVQGAIDKEYTPLCLKSVRKYLPESEIILSTWKGSNIKNLDYDILVLNKDPLSFRMSIFEVNNVKRQIRSTINGIKKSNRKYILKIRTDMSLCGNDFIRFFSKYDKFDLNYKFVKERILVCSLPTRNPINYETLFCISDWITFGLKEDSILLWDIKFPSNEEENWFNIHPRDIKVLYSYDYLIARYNPEQHIIISFIKKFMKESYCDNMFDNNDKAVKLNINILINNFTVLSPKLYNCKFLKHLRNGDWFHILTHKKWLKYYNNSFNKFNLISIDFEKLSYIKYMHNAKKRYYNNGLRLENSKLKALKYIVNNKITIKENKYNYNIIIICKYKSNLKYLNQTIESILIQTHKKIKIILAMQFYAKKSEEVFISKIMKKYGVSYILVYKFSSFLSIFSNIYSEQYFRFINIGDVLHPQTLEFEIKIMRKYKIDFVLHDYITFTKILPNFHINKDNMELVNIKNELCNLTNIIESQIAFKLTKYSIEMINYFNKNRFINFIKILDYIKGNNILKIYPKYIGISSVNLKIFNMHKGVNNMIKMSVIVPTHGRVDLFKETLKCLESQTSKNFEIIVTDDSNLEQEREEIREAVKNFKNKDINIKYIFSKPNLYQAKNTNQGLKLAVGKYIRILHSDDIIANICIEREIEFFEKNKNIDLLYHYQINFHNVQDIVFNYSNSVIIYDTICWLQESIFYLTILPSCMCFRRSLFEKAGGLYEDYKFLCDWKLFFDFLIINYTGNKQLACLGTGLVAWRTHNNNISNNLIFEHFYEHKDFINKIYKNYKELNILSDKNLLDNIYKATTYRFNRLKNDVKSKRSISYTLKYIRILIKERYIWFNTLFTIVLLPLKILNEVLKFISLADVYKERLKRSFIKFWK